MSMFGSMLAGGVTAMADDADQRSKAKLDAEMYRLRKEVDMEYNQRLYERNKGDATALYDLKKKDAADLYSKKRNDALSDTENANIYKSAESEKDRAAKKETRTSKGSRDELNAAKAILAQSQAALKNDDLTPEETAYYKGNARDAYNVLRKKGGLEEFKQEDAPKISWDSALSRATAESKDKATWFNSDETDFGKAGRQSWITNRAKQIQGGIGMLEMPKVTKSNGRNSNVGNTIKIPSGTKDGEYTNNGVTVRVVNGIGTIIK